MDRRYSAPVAYLRITVARLSRRFPIVLDMLSDGRLHLSGLVRLAPHLRDDGGAELLARAAFLTKREIEHLVAEVAPQPDAPAVMRRLPAARVAANSGAEVPEAASGPSALAQSEMTNPDGAAPAPALTPAPASCSQPPRSPAVLTPIAPLRYKVQFTAGAELHDKIERARALLRRQIPDGDLAAVMDRAVTVLLGELEQARFAATVAPRTTTAQSDPTPRSRHIPAAIRRAVWERDGGQCTFRDRHGHRCLARERLEFHHVNPFGQGGDHSVGNVRLVCASHNAFQAELDYGADFMAAHRGAPRSAARSRPMRQAASGVVGPDRVHAPGASADLARQPREDGFAESRTEASP